MHAPSTALTCTAPPFEKCPGPPPIVQRQKSGNEQVTKRKTNTTFRKRAAVKTKRFCAKTRQASNARTEPPEEEKKSLVKYWFQVGPKGPSSEILVLSWAQGTVPREEVPLR